MKVTDILTRHLYLHGDQLLANVTPIALSINELYAITLRLQLPNDTAGQCGCGWSVWVWLGEAGQCGRGWPVWAWLSERLDHNSSHLGDGSWSGLILF